MKLTMQFDIPEEQEDFEMRLYGVRYYSQLHDIDNMMRSKLKYTEMTEAETKLAETIREMIELY